MLVSRAYHGDRDAIEAFLNRPHPLLEGETPFDMARSSSAGARGQSSISFGGRRPAWLFDDTANASRETMRAYRIGVPRPCQFPVWSA